MTQRKHFKRLVRDRMRKTGESYATARRHVVEGASDAAGAHDPHLPGTNPATAALRVLLAGGSRTEAPTEAMVFGVAGGIGAGVFAFRYEKENFSSFFVSGRHRWDDDLAFIQTAVGRFGAEARITESGGAVASERQLDEALARGGPVIAWVDAAHLPHRALPRIYSGGAYHVVVVYGSSDSGEAFRIGDLADEPFEISRSDFSAARGRIKKQKNRLLTLEGAADRDLATAIHEGLAACHHGLLHGRMKNFTIEAFSSWAERLSGKVDKESWDRMFPIGGPLWSGLTSIFDYVEFYGSGGGLMRPMFATFLREARVLTGDERLGALAEAYSELGGEWSALAESALPDGVEAFEEAKRLLTTKSELFFSGGSSEQIADVWKRLGEMRDRAQEAFPLSSFEASDLRRALQSRVRQLYEREVAAAEALGQVVATLA